MCVCVWGGGGGGGVNAMEFKQIMFVFIAKTTIERIQSLFDVTVS